MILLDPLARPLVAHRGASGEFPENTQLAFAQGLAQGADALELDVRLAADGVPVVIHDAGLERTTDGSGPVGGATLAVLRRLDAGRGERIPTLAEVLEAFPATPLIVELKETGAGRPVRRVLTEHGAEGRVLVGSFAHAALRPFGPACRRSASRRETACCWAAARVGGRPFRPRYQAFTVPERYGPITVVDRRFLGAARRMGVPVHVWTVDDPVRAARLRAAGVCGVITNFPGRMRAAFAGAGGA